MVKRHEREDIALTTNAKDRIADIYIRKWVRINKDYNMKYIDMVSECKSRCRISRGNAESAAEMRGLI